MASTPVDVRLWGITFRVWAEEVYNSMNSVTGVTSLTHYIKIKAIAGSVDSTGHLSPQIGPDHLSIRAYVYRYNLKGTVEYSNTSYMGGGPSETDVAGWYMNEVHTIDSATSSWDTDIDCYQKIKLVVNAYGYNSVSGSQNLLGTAYFDNSRYSYPICQISLSTASAKTTEDVVVYTNRTKNVKTSVLFCYGSASAPSYWAAYQNNALSTTIKSSDIYSMIHKYFVSTSLACCVRVYTYTSGGTLIGYTEKTITYSVVIPQISCSTPSFTIGNALTFSTGNNTGLKTKIVIGATAIASDLTSTSWTWSDTAWFYGQMPTSVSKSFVVAQALLNSDGVSLGATYVTITANVNSNVNTPSFGTVSYFDQRSITTGLTGNNQVVIQGWSEVKIKLTGLAPKNSATLSKVVVTYAGKTITGTSPAETCYMIIPSAYLTSNVPVNVTVYDSRGLTSVKTFSFSTWKDYSPPNITLASAIRNNNGIGVDLSLVLCGSVCAYMAEKKMFGYKYRYKEYGASSYGSDVILLYVGSSSVANINYSGVTNSGIFSIAKKYQIEITIYDYFGQTSRTIVVPTASPEISIRENRVGINCIPDTNYGLDVKGVARFQDGARIGTKVVCSGIYFDFISLKNGWVSYGVNYSDPPIVYYDGGVVTFTGLIKSGTVGDSGVIAIIPSFYAPSKHHIFTVATAGGSAIIRVAPDGYVYLYSTGYTGNPVTFLSLAGITYHKTI